MAYPMTSAAIEASLDNLVTAFPQLCTKIPLPNAAPFEINRHQLFVPSHRNACRCDAPRGPYRRGHACA